MFEEEFENMSIEERESALEYMDEYLEAVAYGNGDFTYNNGRIIYTDE